MFSFKKVYQIISGFQDVNNKISDIYDKTRLDRMSMQSMECQIKDKNDEIQVLNNKTFEQDKEIKSLKKILL